MRVRHDIAIAFAFSTLTAAALFVSPLSAQFGGRGGFGGPGVGQDRAVLDQFDRDGNGRLDAEERRAARETLGTQGGFGRGGGRRGRSGGSAGPAGPSPPFDPASATIYPDSVPFYDLSALRTLIFEFENDEFTEDLVAFNDTDVEVPATLTVDGVSYDEVGVRTRGASSFAMVPKDRKLSLNVSVDWIHEDQRIQDYKTLNLLNSNGDPTFLRTVLYLQAAREYMPAPEASFVRVVMNGENRGIYVNVEQFNRDFVEDRYDTDGGARWKVPGSPGGRGGLEYLGENLEAYRRLYDIRSSDDEEDWAALVNLTRVLNETPVDDLPAALSPILDVDETLRFLAIENVFVNSDGYWVRASDYNIYLDPDGQFHILPHDVNEALQGGQGRGGFGRGGRGGGGGVNLDPLVGLNDTTKPLRSRLLAVPEWRDQYMANVRTIATRWLDWNTLEPLVTEYQALIAGDVEADTRKLDTFEAFESGVESLRLFAEQRRAALLSATAAD
jgi:spore coat protein CotH